MWEGTPDSLCWMAMPFWLKTDSGGPWFSPPSTPLEDSFALDVLDATLVIPMRLMWPTFCKTDAVLLMLPCHSERVVSDQKHDFRIEGLEKNSRASQISLCFFQCLMVKRVMRGIFGSKVLKCTLMHAEIHLEYAGYIWQLEVLHPKACTNHHSCSGAQKLKLWHTAALRTKLLISFRCTQVLPHFSCPVISI